VDVPEVGLKALSWVVGQGDEGLAAVAAVASDVASDLVVATGIGVLVLESAEDTRGGVTLLGGSGLIGGEDGVDEGLVGSEGGCGGWFAACVGPGCGLSRTSRTFRREWW